MFDLLRTLLVAAEGVNPPVFDFDRVEQWPEGAVEKVVATGLLCASKPASRLKCPQCGEYQEVVFVDGCQINAYLPCSEAGPVPIPLDRLRTWEIPYRQLMDVAFADVGISGNRDEVVRDRVWRLGRAKWAGASRNVFFARGLHRSDAEHVMHQAQFGAGSVVFVPARLPTADSRIEVSPVFIPLIDVLSWKQATIHFDQEIVEVELKRKLSTVCPEEKRAPKRGSRVALIEQLKAELVEHLRAAHDYALTTLEQTGTPKLLPRPKMELLARRFGVNKSTISRCFEDETAQELRMLWDVAADIDRILYRQASPAG